MNARTFSTMRLSRSLLQCTTRQQCTTTASTALRYSSSSTEANTGKDRVKTIMERQQPTVISTHTTGRDTSSPSSSSPVVTLEDVEDAYKRVSPLLEKTPLQYSPRLTAELKQGAQEQWNVAGGQLFFKMENLHLTGSFKERGAINKLTRLTDEERKHGVVASSAGNHAQAISYHAQRLGIDATIVMPEMTPLAKIAGTTAYGAKVVLFGESLDDSYEEAMRIMENEGRTLVHPYNDKDIIAGQGTMGLELMEQNPYLDTVIIPIGGGGMIGGTAVAMKTVNPRIKIYGVEASKMPGMKASVENRKLTKVPFVSTLADGIAIKNVGDKTFDIIKDYVDDIVTVSDDEIAGAVLHLLEKEKTVVEGAGAASYASLLYGKIKLKSEKKICAVLSGGNIDVSVIRTIIDRGLVQTGRMARMNILIPDSPGQIARCLTLLADLKVNVREVDHDRAFKSIPVGFTLISVTIMTKGHDHIAEIVKTLKKNKYKHWAEESLQ